MPLNCRAARFASILFSGPKCFSVTGAITFAVWIERQRCIITLGPNVRCEVAPPAFSALIYLSDDQLVRVLRESGQGIKP